jgi:hypothetical protein
MPFLCGIFEISPDQALALSLIKRAADLVVGVPGLPHCRSWKVNVSRQAIPAARKLVNLTLLRPLATLPNRPASSVHLYLEVGYWLGHGAPPWLVCILWPRVPNSM